MCNLLCQTVRHENKLRTESVFYLLYLENLAHVWHMVTDQRQPVE